MHSGGRVALEGGIGLVGVVDYFGDDDRRGAVLEQVGALSEPDADLLFFQEIVDGPRQAVALRLPCDDHGIEAQERLDQLQPTFYLGSPDLIVEIVSPDSRRRDRIDKLAEYEAAGVPEYWLIDPRAREAIFRQLDDDGRYRIIEPEEGAYVSRAFEGLRLPVAWLWNPPTLYEAQRAIVPN